MKKLSAVLLILLCASFLSAQVFRSNQLYQKLDELPLIPVSGYALEVQGTHSVLYLDGNAVATIDENWQGTDRIIGQKDLITGTIRTRIYRDGLLIRETESGEEGITETAFTYIDGHLAFCSVIADGTEIDNIFFLRSSNNDEPVAVKDNEGLRFMSGSYMFQSGELYEILSSNLVLTGDYEILESGDILVKLVDGTYTYSPDGLLMKVEQGTAVTINEYEGLNLLRSEYTDGDSRTVTIYVNGKESEILDYEDGSLVSRTTFSETGKEQTLYTDGRELATVYYKMDNRTVDRIEYK